MAFQFDQYASEGNLFIKEFAKALGDENDLEKAGRTLKSVLHALRNQLPIEESFQLLAQLPMFLKAVYVLEWNPRQNQKAKTVDGLVRVIRSIYGGVVNHDYAHDDEIEHAIVVSFIALRKYISLGELEDIRSVLPRELKPLLNSVLMV